MYRNITRYLRSQARFLMLGLLLPLLAGGLVMTAPQASASACSNWKYASWGSAATCVSDSRLSIEGYDRDDKTDGYCVSVGTGMRDSTEYWGWLIYNPSVNCKDGVIKNFSGTSQIGTRARYFCMTALIRGSTDPGVGHLTLWSERGCTV